MKGLTDFAATCCQKYHHIKKKNSTYVKMQVVSQSCWCYLFLPRVSQRSKLPKLCALHWAMDLGRKPEEKIRSFTLPLAKIDQPAVEIRHTVVSSGTSLCLVLFLELHRALHSPGRVLLSRLMRLFVLHPTMLILTPRARTGKLTLQGFPSR